MTWRPDVEDGIAALGLVLVGLGLWWIYPPAALIVVGTVLLLAAWQIGRARGWYRGTDGDSGGA